MGCTRVTLKGQFFVDHFAALVAEKVEVLGFDCLVVFIMPAIAGENRGEGGHNAV